MFKTIKQARNTAIIIQLLLYAKVFGMSLSLSDSLPELMHREFTKIEHNYLTRVPADISNMIWDYASNSLRLNKPTQDKYDPIISILGAPLPYKTKGALLQMYIMTHQQFQVNLLTFPYVRRLLNQMIEKNNVDAIRLIIRFAIEINWRTCLNPLQRAAYQNSVEEARSILQATQAVDAIGANPATPLFIAVLKGHSEMVDLLLRSGADINKALDGEITPLYIAALEDHKDIVRLLFAAGEDAYLENGTTQLFRAAKNGQTELVRSLIETHADINKTFNEDYVPLTDNVLLKGQQQALKLLIEANDEDLKTIMSEDIEFYRDKHIPMISLLQHLSLNKERYIGMTAMHMAAKNGHANIVKLFLRAITDEASPIITESLFLAVINGRLEAVKTLLTRIQPIENVLGFRDFFHFRSGAPICITDMQIFDGNKSDIIGVNTPSAREEYQSSPEMITSLLQPLAENAAIKQNVSKNEILFGAATNGQSEILKILIKAGSFSKDDKRNAFIGAAINGQTEVVDNFLTNNFLDEETEPFSPNKNFAQIAKLSALFGASTRGHKKIVEKLLRPEEGVNPNDDIDEMTPLLGASINGHSEIVHLLIQSGAKNSKSISGITPLLAAAQNGHTNVVKILLAADADPAQTDENGRTPLFAAAVNGHHEIVNLLLEVGADTEQATNNGSTPLLSAALYGHTEVVKLLLQRNTYLDIPFRSPILNPLFKSRMKFNIDLTGNIVIIIDSIQSTDLPNKYSGEMSLLLAAQNGHLEVVKLLLAGGADVHKTNSKNKTALHVAVQNNETEVVKFLLAYDEKVKDEAIELFHRSAQEGRLKILACLLESGIPVDAQTENGKTPLHKAAESGNLKAMQYLLSEGASVLAEDKNGCIPIDSAVEGDQAEAFECLLRRGSPVHILPLPNSATHSKFEQIKTTSTPVSINVAAATSDCERVLTGAANGEIRLWNTSSLESNLILECTSRIIAVDISADGTFGIATSSDKKAFLLNLETPDEQEPVELNGHSNAIRSVQISANGEQAITVGGNEVRIWNLQNKKRISSYQLEGHPEPVISAHMTPNGKHVLTHCEDGLIRHWNLESPHKILLPRILPRYSSKVVSICLSVNGRIAALGLLDHTIRIIDLTNPKISYLVGAHPSLITSMCMNAEGTRILTGSLDNTAKLWDISKLDSIDCLHTFEDHENPVTTTILPADGNYAVTGSNTSLKIWSLQNLSLPPRVLSGHTRLITSTVVTPNATKIITRSADDSVKLWRNSSGGETIIPCDLVTFEIKDTIVYGIKSIHIDDLADEFTEIVG